MLSSFVLNGFRIVEHFPVAVAEDVRRVPALDAQQPRLEPRRDDRLDQRLTGLQILTRQRRLGVRRQVDECRNVGREIRRGIRIGDAFANRRVGVHHARRDRRIVFLERALEVLHGGVRLRLLHVDLGAAAPHHDEPIEIVVFLEQADVFHHLFGEIPLVLAFLDVRSLETLHVALIEDRRPRPDLFELGANLLKQRRLEDAGGFRRGVTVVFENIPPAKHHIVEPGERDDVADLRRAAFGPLAETDRAHLRERADGFREAFANGDNAGDGRGADRSESNEQDSKLAACGSNFNGCRHGQKLYHLRLWRRSCERPIRTRSLSR